MGSQGQTALTPKDEGQVVMLSSFVSQDYGFGLNISKEELDIVNERRRGQH